MTTKSLSQRVTVEDEEALACKVEFVILSILVHYQGYYQDSLVEWYSALRLGVPQLTDTRQLGDVFNRLSESGIIEMRRPTAEASRANGESHDGLFSIRPFTTTLTPMGLVHWDRVHFQPR